MMEIVVINQELLVLYYILLRFERKHTIVKSLLDNFIVLYINVYEWVCVCACECTNISKYILPRLPIFISFPLAYFDYCLLTKILSLYVPSLIILILPI